MLAMDVLAYDKMKSNRRKQSKPIRVSYSAESDAPLKEPQYPSQTFQEDVVNGQSNGKDVTDHDFEDEPMPKSNFQTSIPDCSPKSKELPEDESPSVHSDMGSMENNNDKFSLAENFPTKYHRLGNELLQGNAFVPNGHDDSNNNRNENAEDLSGGSKEINPDEEGRKIDGTNRIFHRDAYCDLCDREFCNKYFLKTHKANKHGIFENSPPPPFSMSPYGASLPQDTLFTPSSTTSPLPFPRPSPAMSSLSSFKIMDFIQNLPASEPKTPQKPQPPVTPSKPEPLPSPAKSDSNPLVPTTSAASTPPSSSSKPVSKDMEDFCELCQKHFCNKYYLKKHKQDVHGIAPPDGGGNSNKRGRPKDLQAQLDAISSAAVTSNSPLMPPHSLPNMAGLPPGVMVLNPFMAPMLIPAGSLMPGQQMPTPPVLSQGMPTSSQSDSISTSASLQSNLSSPSENNRSGTVESFCDLCHKEFCNKYFLKIHMANKHGIFSDDPPLLPGMPGMPPFKFPLSDKSPLEKPGMPIADDHKDKSKVETSPKPGVSLVSSAASPDTTVSYCGLCNQEFANKYAYRIHRLQVHGMFSEGFDSSITEEIIKNSFREKEEYYRQAMKAKEEASLSKISPGSKSADDGHPETKMAENGMTTMFGNMVAAKLADRVTCDICNKDLCNKYFLKVHKFKVHGVDTNTNTPDNRFDPSRISKNQLVGDFELIKSAVNKQEASIKQEPKDFPAMFAQKRPSPMNFPMFPKATDILRDQTISPSANIEKPSNEELVKMGIDPEAYCEICKKEFCSKYFLRTHRLNIHGISTPSTPIPTASAEKYVDKMVMANNSKPLNLSMSGMNGAKKPKQKIANDKHSWRWKEPVNASRVACDICNKEVCNKYFLRTHKLNVHGILPSESSLSPATSDIETTSNSSLPTDLSMHDRSAPSPQTIRLDSNMPSGHSSDRSPKFEEEMNSQYYDESVVCHLCERRFRNLKWLNAHIVNDHGMRMNNKMNSAGYGVSVDHKTCRICEAVFPSEISMHLHMIQEHNAQVSLSTEENRREAKPKSLGASPKFAMKRRFSFVSRQKLYNCSLCDYKSKWLNNVFTHERKEHRVPHRKRKLQPEGTDENKAPGRLTKKYRCTTCNMKFATPILCHLHIREEHIRSKNFSVKNKMPNTRFSCKFCRFSTKFSKQLRHHMTRVHSDGKYLSPEVETNRSLAGQAANNTLHPLSLRAHDMENMDDSMFQQFEIKDCSMGTDFSLSTVKLPVRHRLSGPVTVTFQLNPVEQ